MCVFYVPFEYFLGPYGISNFVDEQMGLLTPLSIAPHWVIINDVNLNYNRLRYNEAT